MVLQHIAAAIAHGIDFLLTWNCKRIANAVIRQQLAKLVQAEGLELPIICTPQELTG